MNDRQTRILRFGEVTSTMDVARERLAGGEVTPFWVMADRQRGGRGRHGRSWHSPQGNLHATLALSDPCLPGLSPQLGFVAGLALHTAVASVTGLAFPRMAIKWPNDLLLDGAKLAGLLLEGSTQGGRVHILIGFGVNIVHAPEETPYRATSLHDVLQHERSEGGRRPTSGRAGEDASLPDGASRPGPPAATRRSDGREAPAGPITAELVLQALARAWNESEGVWRQGFGGIRERWLARAALMGETIRVRLPTGERQGIMRGIDAEGRLLIDTADGRTAIDAGDVFPL